MAQTVKNQESACNEGDLGSIPGLRRSPGGRHGNPSQYSCLENSHGQRGLVGYSPRARKESEAIRGFSELWCPGFSLQRLLLLRSRGSRHADSVVFVWA